MNQKTHFSEVFNNATIQQQRNAVYGIMGDTPVEVRHRIFVVLCDDNLWTKWQIDALTKIRDNMAHGTVHIGATVMRRFKEGWGRLCKLIMSLKKVYDSLDGQSNNSKFFVDLAKMYAHLHNGNMEKYDYYAKKVLAKLNDVMTDSMDDDFVLLGFSSKRDKYWELNTDRVTLKLADMMQTIQLTYDVFMTLRHGSVSIQEADFQIVATD
jgi:hypothetical protein